MAERKTKQQQVQDSPEEMSQAQIDQGAPTIKRYSLRLNPALGETAKVVIPGRGEFFGGEVIAATNEEVEALREAKDTSGIQLLMIREV